MVLPRTEKTVLLCVHAALYGVINDNNNESCVKYSTLMISDVIIVVRTSFTFNVKTNVRHVYVKKTINLP